MRKKNYGFTLVELLAVIAILGIVVSITVFVSIKSINKAKEKSYKTTINNIERMAGTYLEENGDRLFYSVEEILSKHAVACCKSFSICS